MNPIETAVSPLRIDAVARAEQDAVALAGKLLDALQAVHWNLDAVAPRPHGRMSRPQYKATQRRRDQFSHVTRYAGPPTPKLGEPHIVAADDKRIAAFITACKQAAAIQYDAFVAKLIGKVGDCTHAELHGNHVWGHSTLIVTKPDGAVERWRTQQIVNQSVLGTLFNQWPTRKVKG